MFLRPVHLVGLAVLLAGCPPLPESADEGDDWSLYQADFAFSEDDLDSTRQWAASLNSPRCGFVIVTMDFDTSFAFDPANAVIDPGQELTYAYACQDADGNPQDCFPDLDMHIITTSRDGTQPGCGVAFDTANPTPGDEDLLTPNPSGNNNTVALSNVLVKDEHNFDCAGDELIDGPDDDAAGARFVFEMQDIGSTSWGIDSFNVFDVELEEDDLQVRFYQDGQCTDELVVGDDPASGACLDTVSLPVDPSQRGNGARQLVPVGYAANLKGGPWRMELVLGGSGAVGDFAFCFTE